MAGQHSSPVRERFVHRRSADLEEVLHGEGAVHLVFRPGHQGGAEVEVKTSVPAVAEARMKGSVKLSLSAGQTSVNGVEQTVAIDTVIRIAPHSRVAVDIMIERNRSTFQWRGRVKVSGLVTVSKPGKGPAVKISENAWGLLRNQPGFKLVQSSDKLGSWAEGPVSGTFEAVTGLSAVVKKQESALDGTVSRKMLPRIERIESR